jgi:hypothetical protein
LNEPTGVRFALAMTISEAGISVSLWRGLAGAP